MEKEIKSNKEIENFQSDLVTETKQMKYNPPIKVNGSISYV